MIVIDERNEWLASRLVRADSDRMFAGVLAGNNPGHVWVDCVESPLSAIVWSDGLGGFNFMGEARDASFLPSVEPFAREKNRNSFEFSVETEDWYPSIYKAIGNREVFESFQYVYQSKLDTINHAELLNPSYKAVEIDEALTLEWKRDTMKNGDFAIRYIEQFWGSVDNYLGKGYGYVALTDDNEIASLAVSSFVYHSTHTVGVETLEHYQREGLSSYLTKLLLNKFGENRIDVWWDCADNNLASQRTAEKAGLYRARRYKLHSFNM